MKKVKKMVKNNNEDLTKEWEEACKISVDDIKSSCLEQKADAAIDSAERLLALALKLKGVACTGCGGFGNRAYGSTSTWQGGIGGAAITRDVCDKCWGTGRTDKTGADLRTIKNVMRRLEVESSRKWFDEAIGVKLRTCRDCIPDIAKKLRSTRWGQFWTARTAEVIADALEEVAEKK